MGVTRRNDSSSWLARSDYEVNGKRPSQTFNDKKYGGRDRARLEAQQWLKKIDASILEGRFIDPHRNRISLEEFKNQVGIVKLSQRETTKKNIEDVWETYIAPYDIAEMSIGRIADDPNLIAQHIRNLKKETGEDYSFSTISKVVEVFRVLFRKAIEMKYVLTNPAKTQIVQDWIPPAKKKDIYYLSAFEVNKLFTDMQEHSPLYAVMIPLMSYTGLRSGEVRGLHWSDIDFENSTVSITKQFVDKLNDFGPPKNEASIRTIRVPQYVMKYLKEHKSKLPTDCKYLFPNQRGNQHYKEILCDSVIYGHNFRRRHLRPALERVGLPMKIDIHTFRHTSVRLARESGADMTAISKRLGHKDIGTTANLYSELFENIDIELVNNLDDYILQQQIS